MASEQVVVSTGGTLPFRIVHVVVPNPNENASEKDWKDVVKRCLRAAEKSGFTSLAMPAIGTGSRNHILLLLLLMLSYYK